MKFENNITHTITAEERIYARECALHDLGMLSEEEEMEFTSNFLGILPNEEEYDRAYNHLLYLWWKAKEAGEEFIPPRPTDRGGW